MPKYKNNSFESNQFPTGRAIFTVISKNGLQVPFHILINLIRVKFVLCQKIFFSEIWSGIARNNIREIYSK